MESGDSSSLALHTEKEANTETTTPEPKTASASNGSDALLVANAGVDGAGMDDWFRTVSNQACAAMTALQLDYRFDGDDFGTVWWPHAEALGFGRVDYYHYQLPSRMRKFYGCGDVFGPDTNTNDNTIHTAHSLCKEMNCLAIPQGKSVFDRIGEGNRNGHCGLLEAAIETNRIRNTASRTQDLVDQWTVIREELIFRRFHKEIADDCHRNVEPRETKEKGIRASSKDGALVTGAGQKRKLWSSSDAGAELFFHKGKRKKGIQSGKGSKRGNNNSTTNESELSIEIEYPTTLQAYSDCASKHPLNEIATLREQEIAESSFADWRFLISSNHTLLLYGAGSKKNLLERFANDIVDGDVVELDGFDPGLTIDGILRLMIDHWLDGREPTIRKRNFFHVHHEQANRTRQGNTAERLEPYFPRQGDFCTLQKAVAVARRVAREVLKTSRPITLVIHNMDGIGLCNNLAQEVLSVLVSQSRTDCGLNAIRLVASVDDVHAQLFVESFSRHRLNWLQVEVHTHRPYVDEVLPAQALLESQLSQKKSKSRSTSNNRDQLEEGMTEEELLFMEHESIFSVLKSLSSTHAESLRQLAWLHLESQQDWISYTDLLKRCRSERVVQADQQLRLYLGELLDHNILERSNKNVSSITSYRIPYSEEILSLIWNFKRD